VPRNATPSDCPVITHTPCDTTTAGNYYIGNYYTLPTTPVTTTLATTKPICCYAQHNLTPSDDPVNVITNTRMVEGCHCQ